MPALLAPWDADCPQVDESTYALTKDFSDRGVSLVLHQPFKSAQVVVGLWLEGPRFLLGDLRQNVSLGGGFWQIGVELTELLDPAEYPQLESLILPFGLSRGARLTRCRASIRLRAVRERLVRVT
jgi:hypothetical protein